MNTEALKILEDAIADVGYWRYWVAGHKTFQVEFGGIQLYSNPQKEDSPPPGIIALRFIKPRIVAALIRSKVEDFEWFEKLSKDQIEPFTVSYEEFTLTDSSLAKEIVDKSTHKKSIIGDSSLIDFSDESFVAFWSGYVGLAIQAEDIIAVTHEGVIDDERIKERNTKWWAYWKDYWSKRETESALPKDWTCEVTIPVEPEA